MSKSVYDNNVRELHGLQELLKFTARAGAPVKVNDYEYAVPRGIPNNEGRSASALFADGTMLYIVTDYDAGYSEYTPGSGATVSYWVLAAPIVDERKVTP